MNEIDDLLRSLRADVPGPAEGAHERILERARRAQAEAVGGGGAPPPPRRRTVRWGRWAAASVAAAGAATLSLALIPTRGGGGSRAPGLLERAEAAITPPKQIMAFSIRVRSVSDNGAINPRRTIRMRQWTLAGAGRALQMRVLITEGPLDRPPTDEDTTMLLDRTGRVVDQRQWTPLFVRARDDDDYPEGGGRGEIEVGGPKGPPGAPLTLVEQLREDYRHHRLRPAGHTAAGLERLRGRLQLGPQCWRTTVDLDPRTLLPRRVERTVSLGPCDAGGPRTEHEVWTIDEPQSLPASASNRRLLRIGDWPTTRVVRWVPNGAPKPIDRVPPVPPLDEG